MQRREFLALAAAIPTRKPPKVEIAFRSPGPHPNGLQATADGLWIMDQNEGSRVHLVRYEDGSVIRGFETEANLASGITFDGEALWLASTYSRELIRADARTGRTLRKMFTPGAGIIYRMAGDAPARSSPLAKSAPAQRPQAAPQPPPSNAPGTGAHGLEWRDGRLYVAVPPSRTIFRIDPEQWIVEKKFDTAGNRPHGIGWDGKWLWCADSNLNAFFKHDPATGAIVEKIQLADTDPLPHGRSIWQGTLWYCDDVGVVCRLKL